MYGKWICLAILDLVILTYSSPGRFYQDYHTSHDKNPWSGDWTQGWQNDWWQTTQKATRRRTTTPKVVPVSTPQPPHPVSLPQPVIRDIEIRIGEIKTTTDTAALTSRPITLIHEETPSHKKEQDKKPQTLSASNPDNSNKFGIAVVDGIIDKDENPETKNGNGETDVSKDDKKPKPFAPGPENNSNAFGIAVVGATVDETAHFETSPVQETSLTKTEEKPQPVFTTNPDNSGTFQIAPISTIDAEIAESSETKPIDEEASKKEDKKPDSEDNDYTEPHLRRINAVLAAILGTDKEITPSDLEVPSLDEKASLWHVAIYEKKKGRYEHICGGSLIKADLVISAGHCFWSPVWQVLPTTLFRVAAGKLYPRYDDPRDTAAQYSEIKNISISDMLEPCMQPDFAYMNLVTPFRYTSVVKPVCFSLDLGLQARQLKEGNIGTVASWAALENGECRPLRHAWLSLPFIKNSVCQYDTLYKTIGRDRICVGELNNTAECPSDSGNGLVFYQCKIPYLRGVATNLPVHSDCARFYTRSFANIIDRRGIIWKYLKGITDQYNLEECENVYKNPTQAASGGQKNETDTDFGDRFVQVEPPSKQPDDQTFTAQGIGSLPVPTLPDTSAPLYQWHVGVYSKQWSPYMQVCGGTLVKRDFVISAAHCFWDDSDGQQPASQFAVAGGKLFRPWNNTQDTYAQHSEISELILPVRFRGGTTSFQDDIAVLRLTTPFTYAPGVQSACVDFSGQFQRDQLQPGNMGTILGWGLTKENGSPSQRLTYLQLPYLDIEDCFAESDTAFLKYITSDKICAGDTVSGKALCRGDSGGGFILFSSKTPYLHGVASTAAGNQNLCNAFTIAAFTSLYAHRAFLRENIPDIDKECPRNVEMAAGGNAANGSGVDVATGNGVRGNTGNTETPVYTNVPYFPYPNHFVCNCNCKP